MTSTAVIVRETAKNAVDSMNDDLRKVFEELREKLAELSKNDALGRYDVGARVRGVLENKPKYGEKVLDKLADALGRQSDELYNWAQVARVWTRAAFRQLLDRKTAVRGRLSFTHFQYLASVPQASNRNKLLDQCFTECLSTRDLFALSQEYSGGKRSGGGRPRALPKTPTGGLDRLLKMTDDLLGYGRIFEEAVVDKLDEDAARYASKELLDRLKKADAHQIKLQQTAGEMHRKLAAALSAVEKALMSRDAASKQPQKVKRPAATANGHAAKKKASPASKKKAAAAVKKVKIRRPQPVG